MLREVQGGLFHFEAPGRAYGVELGERMAVVRLAAGDLLLYGLVEPRAELCSELDRLGAVRHLCAPNLSCLAPLATWFELYPAAERWAPPGAALQRPDLGTIGELGADPAPGWPVELPYLLVRGIPTLREAVLLHRASQTLLLGDLAVAIPRRAPLLTRAYLRLSLGGLSVGPTRDLRWLVTDRAALRESLRQIRGWSFDRLLPRHGPAVERGGKAALERAYRWLAKEPAFWQ